MKLIVSLEISGCRYEVGSITGSNYRDAIFAYSEEYLNTQGVKPISISLPLQTEPFSAERTKNYFEGLLPEGFSRRAVANWARTDENDYLSILKALGRECIGAVQVTEENESYETLSYKKLEMDEVRALAAEGATKSSEILMETHLSLAGASGKVGLYYSDGQWYLPEGLAVSTHIVKQSHVRLNHIVQNELFCITTAKYLGLDVINSFVVDTGTGRDSEILYATERYDRRISGRKSPEGLLIPDRLHQEDFGMALGIPSSQKYERTDSGYMAKMFEVLVGNVTNPLADQFKLWDLMVFNYLIGNTDCHVKNYSLLYSGNMREINLAPGYDIVCTRAYPGPEDMSFFIGGEISIGKIKRCNFERAATATAMNSKMAMRHFDDLAGHYEDALEKAYSDMRSLGFEEIDPIKTAMLEKGGYGTLSM